MAGSNWSETETLLERLEREAHLGARFVGYLSAELVCGAEITRKSNQSFSGYFVPIARQGVKTALVLFCTRIWEDKPSALLPRLFETLPDVRDSVSRRRARLHDLGIAPNEASFTDKYSGACSEFEALKKHPAHRHLRLLRTEVYAHSLEQSRERKRFEQDGPIRPATWNETLDLAERTIILIGEIGYLVNNADNPYRDHIRQTETYCLEFWRLVPLLGEQEDISDL